MSNENKLSPVTVYAMEDAEPEAPTLSRNLLDEAGLWEDKDREERKKIAHDMMHFGIGLGKINESGNTTRVDPLTGKELQITGRG